MPLCVAKIAVSAATYWVDRPYDYLVPAALQEKALPGVRVYVPFSRGNRRSEGVILALSDHSDYEKLKPITAVLDDAPVLSPEQIKLALFMRERFFCTVYSAMKAMLPAGLWFDSEGRRKIGDKTIEMAKLCLPPEEASIIASNKRLRSPQQSNLLELLCSFACLPSRELLSFTGASRQSLKALEKAGLVELYYREAFRRPEIHLGEKEPLPALNREQQAAFDGINALAHSGKSAAALLFGITGSGKTSVYIHLIMEQLKQGRSAILLVPEISLTPQMIQTFSSHFGDDVAVLHSSLSVGERYDEWKRVRSGKARLAIGTRSAVFAPCENLGLIIIDEEQEPTYKSESDPRYHAREVAKYRAARENCLLLLGSATPSVESYYAAREGTYQLLSLPERYQNIPLPQTVLADMRGQLREGDPSRISRQLLDELKRNLDRGEQSILFINRRGSARMAVCVDCGHIPTCENCSVALTYHSRNGRLMCHHCGYSQPMIQVCPVCGGSHLRLIGSGTQSIEEELQQLLPEARILRMDADTTEGRVSHEKLLDAFAKGKADILLGTQMVAKGLNLPNVTLVGVLDADMSLYTGGYRAGEMTFDLITQVVGRAGRGDSAGRAILQTMTPGHTVLRLAAEQDYDSFFDLELRLRRVQNAPPFADFAMVTFQGEEETQVLRSAVKFRDSLLSCLAQPEYGEENVRCLGPAPCPVPKINYHFRYRLTVNCRLNRKLRQLLAYLLRQFGLDKASRGVTAFVDVNGFE